MRRRRLVTLTSDLGTAYAAQMKAVLYRSDPRLLVIDLSHELAAHGVEEAAFLVSQMAAGFPPETIHVVVVDPGVGGPRASIVIATLGGGLLLGPDNGVLIPLADRLGIRRVVRLDPATVSPRPRVGATFDGRDVFAPAAARLAHGESIESLGKPWVPKRPASPVPRRGGGELAGSVVHVDRFGNLITNIPTSWLPARTRWASVRVGMSRAQTLPVVTSYVAIGQRGRALLGSSFGTLELAVREGSAARSFRAGTATRVRLRPRPGPSRPNR